MGWVPVGWALSNIPVPAGEGTLYTHGLSLQNIFHGGMSLDQLYFTRPAPSYSTYQSPVPGLYLCGSGAHPGKQG